MIRILQGDCRDVLKTLPDASVQCCVTSPPYYGLRDYGTGTWDGGDPECDHLEVHPQEREGRETPGGRGGSFPQTERAFKGICGKCGAVRVDRQIGLEQSPEDYVNELVGVFREVKRVLRDDGVLWLNLGDSYCSASGKGDNVPQTKNPNVSFPNSAPHRNGLRPSNPEKNGGNSNRDGIRVEGIKPKDLLGIPWMVAFALRADGWWLRQDNIWAKRNVMPESVRDRTTRAHEIVFMLTKNAQYYYDATAIEEDGDIPAGTKGAKGSVERAEQANGRPPEYAIYTGKRNKRSVWHVATQPFSDAHFATMPPAIVETCVLAGTSEKGCCPKCGAPWKRNITRKDKGFDGSRYGERVVEASGGAKSGGTAHSTLGSSNGKMTGETITMGWSPDCECGVVSLMQSSCEPIPCTVLDPFSGAGTTALVADRLGRDAIGIELNPEYAEMTRRRIVKDAGMFADIAP